MKIQVRIDAKHGWALIWAGIILWDVFAPETLSAGFARAHPGVKFGAAAIVLGHLFDVMPDSIDPIHQIGRVLGVRVGVKAITP